MSSASHMVATYVHMHIHTYIIRSHCIAQVYSTWVEALQQKHYTHSLLTWKGTNCIGHRPRRVSNLWNTQIDEWERLCDQNRRLFHSYIHRELLRRLPRILSATHASCAVLLYQLTETSTVGSGQWRHHLQCTPAYSTAKYTYYSHQAHLVQVALTVERQGHLHHLSDTRHCEEMTKCKLWPPGSPHVRTNTGERANRNVGSRLTPSSVATAKTLATLSSMTCNSVCAFSYLYSSFAVRSSVLQRSQQAERYNKKTSEEGPSSEKLLLFTAHSNGENGGGVWRHLGQYTDETECNCF